MMLPKLSCEVVERLGGLVGGETKSADCKREEDMVGCDESQERADGRSIVAQSQSAFKPENYKVVKCRGAIISRKMQRIDQYKRWWWLCDQSFEYWEMFLCCDSSVLFGLSGRAAKKKEKKKDLAGAS